MNDKPYHTQGHSQELEAITKPKKTQPARNSSKKVAIIGAGPAGLMAAEVLSGAGIPVDVYDSNPTPGRKLLVAGSSGLNLTHAGTIDEFLQAYGEQRQWLEPMLRQFGPAEVIDWAKSLGIETFTGTSGRIFPSDMKAAALLANWLKRLKTQGVSFHPRHTWKGWTPSGDLLFHTPTTECYIPAFVTILALGGASWSHLGSTGAWKSILETRGVPITPFKPANCGFAVNWSDYFKSAYDGHPLKTISLSFTSEDGETYQQRGEFIITPEGVEGSLIYAFSREFRESIQKNGSVTITLDLLPDRKESYLIERLSRPRGKRTLSHHLSSSVGIKKVKAGLLYEILTREEMKDPVKLAQTIKSLPLKLISPAPLDEAISTAGGIRQVAFTDKLMLKALPGVFCAGEMLDWEAPTGGYLITACLATGRTAGFSALDYLRSCPTH